MFVLLTAPPAAARRDCCTGAPTSAARSRCATSTRARATDASTSSPRLPTRYYDLQRFGLNIVASPRHADVLLVTGAITTRMAPALRAAYEAMPEPRLVAALGDCALGCNLLGQREDLAGSLEGIVPVDLRISGCPPTPETIVRELTAALEGLRRDQRQ